MADENFKIGITLSADTSGAQKAKEALDGLRKEAGDAAGTDFKLSAPMERLAGVTQATVDSLRAIAAALGEDKAESIDKAADAMQGLLDSTSGMDAVLPSLRDIEEALLSVAASGGDVDAAFKDLTASASAALERQAEAYQALDDAADAAAGKTKDAKDAAMGAAGQFNEVARGLANAFGAQGTGRILQVVQLLQRAKDAGLGFAGTIKSIVAGFGPLGLAIMGVSMAIAAFNKFREAMDAGYVAGLRRQVELSRERTSAEIDFRKQIEETGISVAAAHEKIKSAYEASAELNRKANYARKKGRADEAAQLEEESRQLVNTAELLEKKGAALEKIKARRFDEVFKSIAIATDQEGAAIERSSDIVARAKSEREALLIINAQLAASLIKITDIQNHPDKYNEKDLLAVQESHNKILSERRRLVESLKATDTLRIAREEQSANLKILQARADGNSVLAIQLEREQAILKNARSLSDELKIQLNGEGGALEIARQRAALEESIAAKRAADDLKILNLRAGGDEAGAIALEREIARRERINELVKTAGLSQAEAAQRVEASETAAAAVSRRKLDEETAIQILKSKGAFDQAAALEREIARNNAVLALMREAGLTQSEAARYAEVQLSAGDRKLKLDRDAYKLEADIKRLRAAGKTEAADELKVRADAVKLQQEALELAERLKIPYKEALSELKKLNDALNPKPKDKDAGDVKFGRTTKQIEREQEKIKKDLDSDDRAKVERAKKQENKFEDKYGIGINDKASDYAGRDRKTNKLVDPKVGREADDRAGEKKSDKSFAGAAKADAASMEAQSAKPAAAQGSNVALEGAIKELASLKTPKQAQGGEGKGGGSGVGDREMLRELSKLYPALTAIKSTLDKIHSQTISLANK